MANKNIIEQKDNKRIEYNLKDTVLLFNDGGIFVRFLPSV